MENLETKVKGAVKIAWEGFSEVVSSMYQRIDNDFHYEGDEQAREQNLKQMIGYTVFTAGTLALLPEALAIFPGYFAATKALHYAKDRRAASKLPEPRTEETAPLGDKEQPEQAEQYAE